MTRAINPTSSMLLDRSTANPGSIDMAIFGKKTIYGQGTVDSDYLKRCREEDPWPTETGDAKSLVALSNCRIETASENLRTNQPFQMAVDAKAADGSPSGAVSFRLFCTSPDSEQSEDQSATFSGRIVDGVAKATGSLLSPKKPVPIGTKLLYHVVAKHVGAKEKCESPKVEVEAGRPPKPLAVWSLDATYFGFDCSFVLPSAAGKIAEFKSTIDKNPGSVLSVFGHVDGTTAEALRKKVSGRRAFAVFCLLTRNHEGWSELAKGVDGDKWDLRTTQTMLAHLKDASGKSYFTGLPDGKSDPKLDSAIKEFQKDNGLKCDGIANPVTNSKLFAKYMDDICKIAAKNDDFVGDPKDAERQWACSGCGAFNPCHVPADGGSANTNSSNRRATVALFPASAKGPGRVQFPCPSRVDGADKCRKQFFDDAEPRRNPSGKTRTWEKDKDTFSCKFYADISDLGLASTKGKIQLLDPFDTPLANLSYTLKLPGGILKEGKSDSDGYICLPEDESEGEMELVVAGFRE